MAVVFGIGWEFSSSLSSYTNAGWTAGGSPDPKSTTQFYQHPDGYGGGSQSLKCATAESLESPTVFTAGMTGTYNTTFYTDGNYVSGKELCTVLDQSSAELIKVVATDSGANSRLSLLHAGVTYATTGARVAKDGWFRVAVRWENGSGSHTGSIWINNVKYASATTTLSTGMTAGGLKWASPSLGNTYHDHSVVFDDNSLSSVESHWIQGIKPNSDDTNGAWSPNPATTQFYQRILDASDGTFLETTSSTQGKWNLQDRSAVNAAWTNPEVRGVTCWSDGAGDGTLQNGTVKMFLGGSSVTGTRTMPAGGAVVSVFSANKPGGGSWASTDLDNVQVGYEVT